MLNEIHSFDKLNGRRQNQTDGNMVKITITEKILAGNMGDGWRDKLEAANVYAGFRQSRIENELFGIADNYELNIDIDVEDATGWTGGVHIDIEGIAAPDAFELYQDVEDIVDMLDTWAVFCTDERFKYLYETDEITAEDIFG